MQRNLEMRKRNREDTDVAGCSKKKIQGRQNISHSTDPSNNVHEDVSVRKRRAGDDGEMPRKRLRCRNLTNPTEHGEGSVEDRSIHTGKRKASDDGEAPKRKIRCSDSSSSSSSSSFEVTVSSDDDGGDVSQNLSSTLTEEERIYEMSSVGRTKRAGFTGKYCQLHKIGRGGFGSVYAGYRKSDHLPVAIKYIPHDGVSCTDVMCNGKTLTIILEVAFMLKAAGLPGSVGQSAAVSLLDWYILKKDFVLVMERPENSMDLDQYLKLRGGSLDENEAKMILKQLVDATIHLHSKGVFHRDIKVHNILIQLDSGVPRVRIIDFGCGTLSTDLAYCNFCGTRAFFPPEWFDHQSYWARSTTVWQLGAVFYSMLHGKCFSTMGFIDNHIKIKQALSTEVKTLLYMCLCREPFFRATLEDLQHRLSLQQP